MSKSTLILQEENVWLLNDHKPLVCNNLLKQEIYRKIYNYIVSPPMIKNAIISNIIE